MKGLERNCKIKLWLKQVAGSLEKLLEEGGWSVQIILQNMYMKRYRDHLSTFTPAAQDRHQPLRLEASEGLLQGLLS